MEYAFPILIRAIVGIAPFFIGYAILGQCLFWQVNNKFSNFSYAIMTLFCLMNGDNVIPVHDEVYQVDSLFGNLYCYVFVFLSIV